MKDLVLVLAILAILFLLYRNKKSEGFSQEKEVYLFYATWCGHSKAMLPQWEQKVIPHFKDSGVNIISVDVDDEKHKELIDKYNVSAYPTIILSKEGKNVEYQGNRTAEDIIDWVNKQ